MHKYQYTRIVSARAFQLALNSPVYVKPKSPRESVIEVAEREFEEGVVPLRPRPTKFEEMKAEAKSEKALKKE